MKKAIMLAIVLGVAAVAAYAYAADVAATAPAVTAVPAAEAQEAYGEVVSVDANACSVTITEYDYEKDEDINNTYMVDKAATYENVKSLGEVKQGDWVALNIKPQKEGASIATSVYVERYDIGEEAAPAAPVTAPAVPATVTAPAAAPAMPAMASTTTTTSTEAETAPAETK